MNLIVSRFRSDRHGRMPRRRRADATVLILAVSYPAQVISGRLSKGLAPAPEDCSDPEGRSVPLSSAGGGGPGQSDAPNLPVEARRPVSRCVFRDRDVHLFSMLEMVQCYQPGPCPSVVAVGLIQPPRRRKPLQPARRRRRSAAEVSDPLEKAPLGAGVTQPRTSQSAENAVAANLS